MSTYEMLQQDVLALLVRLLEDGRRRLLYLLLDGLQLGVGDVDGVVAPRRQVLSVHCLRLREPVSVRKQPLVLCTVAAVVDHLGAALLGGCLAHPVALLGALERRAHGRLARLREVDVALGLGRIFGGVLLHVDPALARVIRATHDRFLVARPQVQLEERLHLRLHADST
eukprot:scaffold31864_cov73-Phaeocystis_antarctica.AAC.2